MMGLLVISMASFLIESEVIVEVVLGIGKAVLKPLGDGTLMMILVIHLGAVVEVLELAIAGLKSQEAVETSVILVIQIEGEVEVLELAIAGLRSQEVVRMIG